MLPLPQIRTTSAIRKKLPALREELLAAGFHTERLAGEDRPPFDTLAADIPIACEADEGLTDLPPKLRALVRLFHLHEPLTHSELEGALSASSIDVLVESGLVTEAEGGFRTNVFLTSWQDLFLVSDRLDASNEVDSIFPPGPSTAAVAFYLPNQLRNPQRAVDIGTGGGALALLIAKRYGPSLKIDAVDPNPRAIDACVFNAALNGIASIEAYPADHQRILSSPQFENKVDLLTWNMPLAWQADVFALTYDGEQLMKDIYEALPRVLAAERGHAVLRHDAKLGREWFAQWIHERGGLPGFQALLRRESENARANRPFPQDEAEDRPYLLSLSMIAPRRGAGATSAASVIDFDSWREALFGTTRSEWQERIRAVRGWEAYELSGA